MGWLNMAPDSTLVYHVVFRASQEQKDKLGGIQALVGALWARNLAEGNHV